MASKPSRDFDSQRCDYDDKGADGNFDTKREWDNRTQHQPQHRHGSGIGNPEDKPPTISCDACRRRKIKCSKTRPCSQCAESFLDCTYSERATRRKRRRLLSLGHCRVEIRPKDEADPKTWTLPATTSPATAVPVAQLAEASSETCQDATNKTVQFGPMTAPRHLIEHGEIEFQGYHSDRTFIQGLPGKLGCWPGDAIRRMLPGSNPVPDLFNCCSRLGGEIPLPPRPRAVELVQAALDAQLLLNVVHRPTFDTAFNLTYSLEPSQYTVHERRFLSLLYAMFAYGRLFVQSAPEEISREEMVSEATQYYIQSKTLLDIGNCKDLVSLQAIVFINLFLRGNSRAGAYYTFACASLSIALRMGLHRFMHTALDMVSTEISRRAFWALKSLADDVAVCVGLPMPISDDDIDQELQREVSDACILQDRILKQPKMEICYAAGSNAYLRLQMIQKRMIKTIQPQRASGALSHTIQIEAIRQIEKDLRQWSVEVPWGFRLGTHQGDTALCRAQYVLMMTYTHIQLCIYRPFLHYDAVDATQTQKRPSDGVTSYTAACMQSGQNIISLSEDMFKRGLLTTVDSPIARILCSSLMTLLYTIVLMKGGSPTKCLLKPLATGRRILSHLGKSSFLCNRAKTILTILIATLPSEMEAVRGRLLNVDEEVANLVADPAGAKGLSPDADPYLTVLVNRIISLSSNMPPDPGSGFVVSDRATHPCIPSYEPLEPCSVPSKISPADDYDPAKGFSASKMSDTVEGRRMNFHAEDYGGTWMMSGYSSVEPSVGQQDGAEATFNDNSQTMGMYAYDDENFLYDFQPWF